MRRRRATFSLRPHLQVPNTQAFQGICAPSARKLDGTPRVSVGEAEPPPPLTRVEDPRIRKKLFLRKIIFAENNFSDTAVSETAVSEAGYGSLLSLLSSKAFRRRIYLRNTGSWRPFIIAM